MDDGLALEALLEISRSLDGENDSDVANKKFPLLDNSIVEAAIGSVAYIFENKQKARKPCTKLVKKWCDVGDVGVSCKHVSWMGNDSGLANIDCVLAACKTLSEPSSTTNLLSLDVHQQQAICLAVSRLAADNVKARKLTRNLYELIIDHPQSISSHSDFLCEVWNLRELLELSMREIEILVKKGPVGLENDLLSCLTKYSTGDELYQDKISSLVNLSVSSPLIFQVSTSILMHLVERSNAHEDIVTFLSDFVCRCTSAEKNVVRLFPAKCQLALALLNILPEEVDSDSYEEYLLEALRELPSSVSTLLLIFKCRWLPLLADKL